MTAIATSSRGASIISVGDFADRRVLNYLDGPIVSWGEQLFGALPGDAPLDGATARLSAAEIDGPRGLSNPRTLLAVQPALHFFSVYLQ